MEAPRIYAARVAARLLLRKIWTASPSENPTDVLSQALNSAARELVLKIEFVAAILNDRLIAGEMDRFQRRILISTRFSTESQRFTLAHEFGHYILHPGKIYFRDRELAAPDLGGGRPYQEIEADAFAAEFLIPRKHLEKIFAATFGNAIDGTKPDIELAAAVSSGKDRQWTARDFASATPLERARAIASATTHKGRFFTPLARRFGVSRTAMAIQLIRTELVG
jgi:Zn-dependent peptidase ImmA (M78 family)